MPHFSEYSSRVARIAEDIETIQRDLHVDPVLRPVARVAGEINAYLITAHVSLEHAVDLMREADGDDAFRQWVTNVAGFATPANFPVEYAASEEPAWLPLATDQWLADYSAELTILYGVGVAYDTAARVMIAYMCNDYHQTTIELRVMAALVDVTESREFTR